MIAEVDNQILQWTTEVLGESIATLGPPAQAQKGRGVGVYLLDVTPEPREHLTRRPRLQAWLRYLITCWDESGPEAHRLLGALLESAMQHPEFEIVTEPPSAEVWKAFGVAPQPCLTLRTRTWKELEPRPVKLVRRAVFETVPGRPLQGVVLGPEAIPICDAVVELPGLHLWTRTGRHGEFEFPQVPVTGLGSLRVRARGREMTVDLGSEAVQSPLSINLEMKE